MSITADSPSPIDEAVELNEKGELEKAQKKPDKIRPKVLDYVGPVVVFGLFIGFWYSLHYWGMRTFFDKPKWLVPPPHRVIHESFFVWRNTHKMLRAIGLSAQVAVFGLIISIVIGMTLAILMSQARWIERSIWPYAVALQAVPILAFVPLIQSILDAGFTARVLVCVIIAVFPIIANTLFGLLSVEKAQHDLFTLAGVSRWTRLTKLQLPAAMPAIFAGFRIAAGLSVIGAVVGDFFFRQGNPGIGILIDVYRARNLNSLMFGAVILAAALGIAVFLFFGWLANRAVGHWHEATRGNTR